MKIKLTPEEQMIKTFMNNKPNIQTSSFNREVELYLKVKYELIKALNASTELLEEIKTNDDYDGRITCQVQDNETAIKLVKAYERQL